MFTNASVIIKRLESLFPQDRTSQYSQGQFDTETTHLWAMLMSVQWVHWDHMRLGDIQTPPCPFPKVCSVSCHTTRHDYTLSMPLSLIVWHCECSGITAETMLIQNPCESVLFLSLPCSVSQARDLHVSSLFTGNLFLWTYSPLLYSATLSFLYKIWVPPVLPTLKMCKGERLTSLVLHLKCSWTHQWEHLHQDFPWTE